MEEGGARGRGDPFPKRQQKTRNQPWEAHISRQCLLTVQVLDLETAVGAVIKEDFLEEETFGSVVENPQKVQSLLLRGCQLTSYDACRDSWGWKPRISSSLKSTPKLYSLCSHGGLFLAGALCSLLKWGLIIDLHKGERTEWGNAQIHLLYQACLGQRFLKKCLERTQPVHYQLIMDWGPREAFHPTCMSQKSVDISPPKSPPLALGVKAGLPGWGPQQALKAPPNGPEGAVHQLWTTCSLLDCQQPALYPEGPQEPTAGLPARAAPWGTPITGKQVLQVGSPHLDSHLTVPDSWDWELTWVHQASCVRGLVSTKDMPSPGISWEEVRPSPALREHRL